METFELCLPLSGALVRPSSLDMQKVTVRTPLSNSITGQLSSALRRRSPHSSNLLDSDAMQLAKLSNAVASGFDLWTRGQLPVHFEPNIIGDRHGRAQQSRR